MTNAQTPSTQQPTVEIDAIAYVLGVDAALSDVASILSADEGCTEKQAAVAIGTFIHAARRFVPQHVIDQALARLAQEEGE